MAILSAPFLSQSASGTVGCFFTVEKRGAVQYAYKKKAKAGYTLTGLSAGFGHNLYGASFFGYTGRASRTGSQAQGARRVVFLAGWTAYALLTPDEKAILSEEARVYRVTGANLFMRRWLQDHRL